LNSQQIFNDFFLAVGLLAPATRMVVDEISCFGFSNYTFSCKWPLEFRVAMFLEHRNLLNKWSISGLSIPSMLRPVFSLIQKSAAAVKRPLHSVGKSHPA